MNELIPKNKSQLRTFPNVRDRIDSGPVRFGDDWPGIYLRGDVALALALKLDRLAKHLDEPVATAYSLAETAHFLRSCLVDRLGVDVPAVRHDSEPH